MGLLHIFIWFLWEDYLVKVWGHWPYCCRTNLNFYGPRRMKASFYSIQNHKMNLKTLNSRCLLKTYCEFAEKFPGIVINLPIKNSSWVTQRKLCKYRGSKFYSTWVRWFRPNPPIFRKRFSNLLGLRKFNRNRTYFDTKWY